MTRAEIYRRTLKQTERILKRKHISAADLARELETTRQTAYARIEALKSLGLKFDERYDRVGEGPATCMFKIVSGSVPDGPA